MARYDLTEFGRNGERWVAEKLRGLGFAVEAYGGPNDFDLMVGGSVRVEVKTARVSQYRKGRGGAFQFSLRRHQLEVDEDLLILLCWRGDDDVVAFVIPGMAVDNGLCKVTITSEDPFLYGGKWAKYRENWSQVGEIVESAPVLQEDFEISF